MHFSSERLNALAQFLDDFGQFRILLQQHDQLRSLLRGKCLSLFTCDCQSFPVLRIGISVCFVSIRLPRLCQQDEWRGIRRLKTESKVQQDERVDVKLSEAGDVGAYPEGDENGLRDQEYRCAKESSKGFRL